MRTEFQIRHHVYGEHLPKLGTGTRIVQGYITTGRGESASVRSNGLLIKYFDPEQQESTTFLTRLTKSGLQRMEKESKKGEIPIDRGFEARIRIKNNSTAALALIHGDGNERRKTKAPVDIKDAEKILRQGPIVGHLISKTRFDVTETLRAMNRHVSEAVIDVYDGMHEGLKLLVVEFETKPHMKKPLITPSWVGAKVRSSRFNNSQLAVCSPGTVQSLPNLR